MFYCYSIKSGHLNPTYTQNEGDIQALAATFTKNIYFFWEIQ